MLIFLIIGGLLNQFKNDRYGNILFCGSIIISVGLLVGSRGVDVGTDTEQYYTTYREFSNLRISSLSDYFVFGGDIFFKIVMMTLSKVVDYNIALILISFTISTLNYLFARGIVRLTGYGSISLLFLFMMSNFVTWNEQTNIMRAGIGTGFYMCFLLALYKQNIRWAIIYGLLAVGNHFSTAIFIGLSLIAYFSQFKIKTYIISFFVFIALAYIGISVLSVSGFGDIEFKKVEQYTSNIERSSYQTGFRFTFALFNTICLILPLLYRKYLNKVDKYLLKIYILSSILFFMWFTIPFSDRIGAFSWTLIPALIYLSLSSRYKRTNTIPLLSILGFGVVFYCLG